MSDLIWIGNTLYPRWLVIAIAGIVVLGFCTLISVLARNSERHHG